MRNLCHVLLLVLVIAVPPRTHTVARAEDAPKSGLAFTRAGDELRFDTGVLRGTLHAGGKSLGLQPVIHVGSGRPIAGPFGLLSPYRMLTADARFGTAAWDWASKAGVLPDGAAGVRWSPDKEHPLAMTGVYRCAAPDTVDLALTVKPERDLRRFELFLASYFRGFPASLAYVQSPGGGGGAGRFMAAVKAGGVWQTFPRDDATAAIFGDGRWARPPHPVVWTIMPRLAAPLALRRDAASGLTAVLMSRPDDCFAVSMPYGDENHRSVYFSLFGVHLKAGQEVTAHVRLVIGREISDDRARELYGAYFKN